MDYRLAVLEYGHAKPFGHDIGAKSMPCKSSNDKGLVGCISLIGFIT
jgi:hypothetical protein